MMPTTTMMPTIPMTRARRIRPGFRARVLGVSAALLALAIAGGLVAQRTIRLERLEREIESELEQERRELELLAAGRDPATGEAFEGNVRAIFDTFLGRNVPAEGEVYLTFVDGRIYRWTPTPLRLDQQPELVARWLALTTGVRDSLETPAGPVRYLVVPLRQNEQTQGHFVVAFFLEERLEEIDSSLRLAALTSGVMLVLATGAAWLVAGRLLRPLRRVTERARTITETDLSGRIEVEGDDEIAELGRTFNEMLDRLGDAFEVQRRFVDDAGHELRTPITIVRGHLELMGDDPEERAETLALVTDELDRMARIVDDLLVLAKAEQPDFVHPEPIELSDVTTELLVKARALGDRDWRLAACGEGTIAADPQRLAQAVLNLARNAVEHTVAGTRIDIGSAREAGEVRLWVSDSGPGIDSADRDRIFDRFARGRGVGRRSEGAGLGLAIVRAVAEGHGGRVDLVSEVGEGSTFTIVLPDVIPYESDEDENVNVNVNENERTAPWPGS